jgi:hypothetical protein
MIVPFLPTLLALGVLTIEVAVGHKLYLSDWYIAMVLVVLSLARQLLVLIQQMSPIGPSRRGRLEEATGA